MRNERPREQRSRLDLHVAKLPLFPAYDLIESQGVRFGGGLGEVSLSFYFSAWVCLVSRKFFEGRVQRKKK